MIAKRALDLILESEGIDQPCKWPGGESGITIGYGYDLGYEENFVTDWTGHLSPPQIDALKPARGLRGEYAKEIASCFKWITIRQPDALEVFEKISLPHYEEETRRAFPGLENLPELAQGALVSLVFNRGSGMVGARRAEMRAIRSAVVTRDLPGIARQLRKMKRLWMGKGLDGLLVRREAEAELVLSATGGIA